MNKYILVIPFLLFLFGVTQAQSSLTALVVDSASGEPIVGVNVSVESTTLGGTTDIDGKVIVKCLRCLPVTITSKAAI